MYLPAVTHVAPLLTIRRERRLPTYGQILVRVGDPVDATDVIGRAARPGQHRILDVARALKLSKDAADAHLVVDPGAEVAQGQVLAETRRAGFLRRRVRAPFDAEVVAAGDGRILLAGRGRAFELRAFLPGTVVNVRANVSALIETTGALIQARWGSGRKAFGPLRVAAPDPAQPVPAESLDAGYQDAIVAVGGMLERDSLAAATAANVRGLVAGSMPGDLVAYARELPFPVLLTEGFGDRTMPAETWALLSTHSAREVVLDANPTDRFAGLRPELIVPLPPGGAPAPVPVEGEPLVVGKRVRIVRPPYSGEIGVAVGLPDAQHRFASGLLAHPVEVALEGRATVRVPRENVELFEGAGDSHLGK